MTKERRFSTTSSRAAAAPSGTRAIASLRAGCVAGMARATQSSRAVKKTAVAAMNAKSMSWRLPVDAEGAVLLHVPYQP